MTKCNFVGEWQLFLPPFFWHVNGDIRFLRISYPLSTKLNGINCNAVTFVLKACEFKSHLGLLQFTVHMRAFQISSLQYCVCQGRCSCGATYSLVALRSDKDCFVVTTQLNVTQIVFRNLPHTTILQGNFYILCGAILYAVRLFWEEDSVLKDKIDVSMLPV
jgi:hypothetical protein